MSDSPAWVQALRERLPAELARRGLAPDARTWLNVEIWLQTLLERDALGMSPETARIPVRAIVAKSRREQDVFDQAFAASVETMGEERSGPTEDSARGESKPGCTRQRFLAELLPALTPLVLLFVIWLGWQAFGPEDTTPSQPTATIPNQDRASRTLDLSKVVKVGKTELLGKVATASPTPQAPSKLYTIPAAYWFVLALLLALPGMATSRTVRNQLARITTRERLREQEVFAGSLLPVAGERRRALRGAARLLRQPQPSEGWRLDIPASVAASAARAGLFEARHRQHRNMPGYLVLVDRASAGDQQAHWAFQMVRNLAAEGVSLLVYEFDGDPRRVAPVMLDRNGRVRAPRPYRPLSELAADNAGKGLLVFADGLAWIAPVSNALAPWLAPALHLWPRRVLLTPRPALAWDERETCLAAEGADGSSFLVLPATTASLLPAAVWLQTGKLGEILAPAGLPGPMPASLVRDGLRYLSRAAPPPEEIRSLVAELHISLGLEAYTWLAASAAYPHLSAELTAYLAQVLGGDQDMHQREARLLAIAQLPWCRQGWMPDWLRHALYLGLAPEFRKQVEQALRSLFAAASGGANLSLGRIATASEESPGFFSRLAGRLGLDALVRGDPPDSPMRDAIYLGILRGDYDPSLVLEVDDKAGALPPVPQPRRQAWPRWGWAGYLLVLLLFLGLGGWRLYATEPPAQTPPVVPQTPPVVPPTTPPVTPPVTPSVTPPVTPPAAPPAASGTTPPIAPDAKPAAASSGPPKPATSGSSSVSVPTKGDNTDPTSSKEVSPLLRDGDIFRDCPDCPPMVAIPAGNFLMGSPKQEAGRYGDEGPQHEVKVPRFALARTEVTLGQFLRFVEETGYKTDAEQERRGACRSWGHARGDLVTGRSWKNAGFLQDNDHPAVYLSWNDAQAYVAWLSNKTGQKYRLPSEAEWEYAARAGSKTARPWGDDPDAACAHANVADQTATSEIPGGVNWKSHNCRDGYAYTAPVGMFAPNRFGLVDMIGNVWEWTADRWHDSYKDSGRPDDGRSWERGVDIGRVLRGGSWFSYPESARSAKRDRNRPVICDDVTGFRPARMLP